VAFIGAASASALRYLRDLLFKTRFHVAPIASPKSDNSKNVPVVSTIERESLASPPSPDTRSLREPVHVDATPRGPRQGALTIQYVSILIFCRADGHANEKMRFSKCLKALENGIPSIFWKNLLVSGRSRGSAKRRHLASHDSPGKAKLPPSHVPNVAHRLALRHNSRQSNPPRRTKMPNGFVSKTLPRCQALVRFRNSPGTPSR
jgi:hypothetical protein